jgi:Right handed beta helix region
MGRMLCEWIHTSGLKLTAILLAGSALVTTGLVVFAADSAPDQAANPQPAEALESTQTVSDPLVIKGEDGTIIDGVRISSKQGDCIRIVDSTNITIRNSVIGPCAGRGVSIEGGSQVSIVGNRIQSQFKPRECCDTGDGVFATQTSDLLIDANDIAYSETNVELISVEGARITNNSLANPLGPFPRGQQIQVAGGEGAESRQVFVAGNSLVASQDPIYNFKENQEDAINLYFARSVTIEDNEIRGGTSASGCGILVDDGANEATISDNRIFDTGQCGIGVASGMNHVIHGNRILLTKEIPDGGNVALYAWNQYELPCGGVSITDNVATFVRANGVYNDFHDGGGCDPVNLSENTFGEEAYRALLPELGDTTASLAPGFFPLENPTEPQGFRLDLDLTALLLGGAAISVALFALGRRRISRSQRRDA